MKRSHRIVLKPTPEQESLFRQHSGYARFAYNWALAEFKARLDVGEWLSERTLRPRWNLVKGMITPWGVALSQNAAKYAIIDLGPAAEGWGEYCRRVRDGQRPGRRVGFPRFKRRKHEQGCRADNGPDTVRVDGKVVIVPRIGRVDIADPGMSGFLAKLEYKCGWYGTEYVKADRWFASSKLCARCRWKNDDLTLSDRNWWCGGRGTLNDLDANAAMDLEQWPGLSFPVSGRGDRVSPARPAVVGEASNESGETSTVRGVSDFIRF